MRTRVAKASRAERKGVTQLINIENSIKVLRSRGYEQWAKIQNLKQAVKPMNFLTENQIDQYTDLVARIEVVTTASEQAANALKGVEKRFADMALLIKKFPPTKRQSPSMTHTGQQKIKCSTAPDRKAILSCIKPLPKH